MANQPQFGVALPTAEGSFPGSPTAAWPPLRQLALRCEELGYDSVWLCDHLLFRFGGIEAGLLECWTALAALAAETRRVRVGTLVTCPIFRHPGLLARMAATLDRISGGRLIVGLGAGWHEAEYRAYGLPFERPGRRVARLREVVAIVGAMLTEEKVTYQGSFYQLEGALGRPGPVQRPRPPIWVAALGSKMLRLTAELADGWSVAWTATPEEYRRALTRFHGVCHTVGRDPTTVTPSLGIHTLVAPTWRELDQVFRHLPSGRAGQRLVDTGQSLQAFGRDKLVGTPAEVAERIAGLAAAGVRHFILNFGSVPFSVASADMVDLFAREVLPGLGSTSASSSS